MPVYDVTAWRHHTHYSTLTVTADSPAAAIEQTREQFQGDVDDWHGCDEMEDVHFMVAEPNIDAPENEQITDDTEHHADWSDGKEDAARAMLAALTEFAAWRSCAESLRGIGWESHVEKLEAQARAAIAAAQAAGIKAE